MKISMKSNRMGSLAIAHDSCVDVNKDWIVES